MKNMAKFVLGAAVVAGGLGLGATKAQAAEFGVYIGGPNYVPPSPGPGYEWTAGYYANGYWVPGRWGYGRGYDRDRVVRYDRDRGWDHDRGWGHDRDGYRDRDRHFDHDRDHYRR
ncbi:MAG TPA: hypothetical protein VGG85_02240 [Terracidiphilus sp.]|jgi:hypothetical protein